MLPSKRTTPNRGVRGVDRGDQLISVIVFEYQTGSDSRPEHSGQAAAAEACSRSRRQSGSVSVGVASAQILAANLGRKGLQVVNASANAISIGLGHAAVLGNDIWLAAGGGAWDGTISGKLWLGSLFAIAAGAASDLAIIEA